MRYWFLELDMDGIGDLRGAQLGQAATGCGVTFDSHGPARGKLLESGIFVFINLMYRGWFIYPIKGKCLQ